MERRVVGTRARSANRRYRYVSVELSIRSKVGHKRAHKFSGHIGLKTSAINTK